MKKSIFLLSLILSTSVFSQEVPEGWDKIILEGKVAYMNLVTGDVSNTFPQQAARAPKKVVEFEPTKIHYVEKGETFSKIARKYNMSLSELYKLNNREDFDTIEVGQEVVIGYRSESEVENQGYVNNNTSYSDTDSGYHVVKTGETLYRISQNYNLSVKQLKILNSLKSNNIFIGQKLQVR